MRALRREREYILKAERELPEDEQTVWLLRSLDLDVSAQIQDRLVQLVGSLAGDEEPRTLVFSGTQEVTILLNGLIGWRNFCEEGGAPIPFPDLGRFNRNRDALKEWLARIPPEARSELAQEIVGRSRLGQEERGNSKSPSASPALGGGRPAPDGPTSAPAD